MLPSGAFLSMAVLMDTILLSFFSMFYFLSTAQEQRSATHSPISSHPSLGSLCATLASSVCSSVPEAVSHSALTGCFPWLEGSAPDGCRAHSLPPGLCSNVTSESLNCPDWCSSVDQACEPEGHQSDSQSRHVPRLRARSLIGGTWGATTH